MQLFSLVILFAVLISAGSIGSVSAADHRIDAVPEGYVLHAYDNLGVAGVQPHLRMEGDTYLFTYGTNDNSGSLRERSAVFSYKQLRFDYNDLDPHLSYVLSLTYATDQVYKRVQSLWADGVELHGPIPLPKGSSIRVFVRVPREVTQDGKMQLEIRIHGEVNATASEIELWADGPATAGSVGITSVWGYSSQLVGRIVDIRHDGIVGAAVVLMAGDGADALARTTSEPGGWFRFDKSALAKAPDGRPLKISATAAQGEATFTVPEEQMTFRPVRYIPIPAAVSGLKSNQISLDGKWRFNPRCPDNISDGSTDGADWHDFRVPGQWRQQGYDIPQDQPVALAREFDLPAQWAGRRIMLRFEAVHAGTDYWLNGKKLGYSENLFTPVEWDITDAVATGSRNSLRLAMKVATVSEGLSTSSGYAFHNLGGIDRTVSVYALPNVHVRNMRVFTDLDSAYRNADLRVEVTLHNAASQDAAGLSVVATLEGPDGKKLVQGAGVQGLAIVGRGEHEARLIAKVSDPLKWSAEKPNLYKMILEVKQDAKVLERIERNIGFRKVEVKGSQVYVNGVVVKLAGACHHEVDPLTGRAGTAKHAVKDAELLKQANLNYIRTSHYPPTKELVEAADRIGMYLEVEAPFCWVAPTDDIEHLSEILTPTTAMVDYYNSHPSVIVWSIANESHLNEAFVISEKLVSDLDPSRLTTFNHPFSKDENEKWFDLSNRHYVGMPYDEVLPNDPHPLIFGEYYFPICHEQTDVMINPGLRELWGHGHADPESAYAKECAQSFTLPPLKPGTPPGAWTYIVNSKRVAGGVIWAALDDSFYFSDGTHAGYSWHHGFWGLIDAWRRPKPEWWLSKMVHSPVWFAERKVSLSPGQSTIAIPVENRYSFTDFGELSFAWKIGAKKGTAKASVPPRSKGELTIALPEKVTAGDMMEIRVTDASSRLVNAGVIQIGESAMADTAQPKAGPPDWTEKNGRLLVSGKGFALAFDKKTGNLDPASADHKAAIMQFPSLHLTRYDFGDLAGPNAEPYEILPRPGSRVVDAVEVRERAEGLEITVRDHYDEFKGAVSWLIDREGMTTIRSDYNYEGHDTNIREIGVRLKMDVACNQIRWRRWSEWGVFPDASISRTKGSANAWRKGQTGPDKDGVTPEWPWSQDQTAMGTSDFRSIKFHVYDAALTNKVGGGARVVANADAHFRTSMDKGCSWMHIISRCPLGQIPLKAGDKISNVFKVKIEGKAGDAR